MTKNIILVTGSSSGIGRGIVETLDVSQYFPIITYNTHKDSADEAKNTIIKKGGECLVLRLDVTNDESVQACTQKVMTTFGRLDTLVCNAGKDYYHESSDEVDIEEWQDVFSTKVFGTFSVVHALRPLLAKSNNANIIGIAASLYEKPDSNDPAYSSACAAHVNYIMSLVIAFEKDRIRANLINPGPVKTNLKYWQDLEAKVPTIFADMATTSPTGRLGSADDIASSVDYIVSCRNLNGTILNVNAGAHLR